MVRGLGGLVTDIINNAGALRIGDENADNVTVSDILGARQAGETLRYVIDESNFIEWIIGAPTEIAHGWQFPLTFKSSSITDARVISINPRTFVTFQFVRFAAGAAGGGALNRSAGRVEEDAQLIEQEWTSVLEIPHPAKTPNVLVDAFVFFRHLLHTSEAGIALRIRGGEDTIVQLGHETEQLQTSERSSESRDLVEPIRIRGVDTRAASADRTYNLEVYTSGELVLGVFEILPPYNAPTEARITFRRTVGLETLDHIDFTMRFNIDEYIGPISIPPVDVTGVGDRFWALFRAERIDASRQRFQRYYAVGYRFVRGARGDTIVRNSSEDVFLVDHVINQPASLIHGITDGTHIWYSTSVTGDHDSKVIATGMPGPTLNTAVSTVRGIIPSGLPFYTESTSHQAALAYNQVGQTIIATRIAFNRAAFNSRAQNTYALWVREYPLTGGDPTSSYEIPFNRTPFGFLFGIDHAVTDGHTLWLTVDVAGQGADRTVFAFNLSRRERDEHLEFMVGDQSISEPFSGAAVAGDPWHVSPGSSMIVEDV